MANKVLVTGNAGFIGQWLTPLLAEKGFEVVGVDLKPIKDDNVVFRHYQCDINDFELLFEIFSTEQPAYVIHLAARTDLDGKTLDDYKSNILGTQNVTECCLKCGSIKATIITSSMLVCEAGHIPKSDTEYKPTTLYGESKVKTEEIVRERFKGSAFTWTIVRPTTVWGPGMNEHYERFFKFLKKGYYFHSGKKEIFKSYGFVENIAFEYYQLMLAVSSEVNGKTFYFSDYKFLSMNYYVDKMSALLGGKKVPTMPLFFAKFIALGGDMVNALGYRFPFNSFRLKNILTEYQFDMSTTRAVCGDLPVDHDTGIQKTADWLIKKWTRTI